MNINVNPFDYCISEYELQRPSCIHKCDNYAFLFWCRALAQRILSVFKINNLPEEWQGELEDFLENCLVAFGYVAVSSDSKHGLYFSPGSLAGVNMYYQPTCIVLSNPEMSGKQLKLHKECELIRFTPDYAGVTDIIAYYAAKLALIDTSINSSLITSKQAYNMLAKSKSVAQALKVIADRTMSGEVCTVVDQVAKPDKIDNADGKTPLVEMIKLFSKADYITTDLLNDFSTILNQFDAEVGIPSVPYEKKERLVTAEATSRKLDSTARARVWLDSLKSSCKLVNKKYSLNLEPVLSIDEFEEEVNTDVRTNDNSKEL